MGITSVNIANGASYGAYNQKLTPATRAKLEELGIAYDASTTEQEARRKSDERISNSFFMLISLQQIPVSVITVYNVTEELCVCLTKAFLCYSECPVAISFTGGVHSCVSTKAHQVLYGNNCNLCT